MSQVEPDMGSLPNKNNDSALSARKQDGDLPQCPSIEVSAHCLWG